MELVTVASLPSSIEAHLLRTLLESEGIPATILDEHISNTFLPIETLVGGVQLQVRAEDEEEARAIIERAQHAEIENEEEIAGAEE